MTYFQTMTGRERCKERSKWAVLSIRIGLYIFWGKGFVQPDVKLQKNLLKDVFVIIV